MPDDVIASIWTRAVGGGDVAAAPGRGSDDALPFGPSAAGAQEATAWFSEGALRSGIPLVLLLVGGPGSGKSALAARAVSAFDAKDPPSPLAQRSYRYSHGAIQVLLVNDATIESEKYPTSPLIQELSECITNGVHVLSNVNRGVIVEELAVASGVSAGRVILNWLQHPKLDSASDEWNLIPDQDGASVSYFENGTLYFQDEPSAEVAAVFMDSCSLFEIRPDCVIGERGILTKPYQVTRFSERSELDLRLTAAGSLLVDLCKQLPQERPTEWELDPIAANLESLKNPRLQQGFVSLLRAAEIVTGARFTYRELWGAIGRLTLGHLPSEINSTELDSWIARNQPQGTNPVVDFHSVMRLASHRGWQSLFGTDDERTVPVSERVDESNPVLRFTSRVDPVMDSHHDWSKPLFDAFMENDAETTPLGLVMMRANEELQLETIVAAFDWKVDSAFAAALGSSKMTDPVRRQFTSWYGRYLARLLGMANSAPAFLEEVATWTSAWMASPDLPDALAERLRILLLPSDTAGGNALFLPVFDSRTIPITAAPDRSLLVRKVDQHWSLTSQRLGDQLTVQLVAGGKNLVELDLDFTMMREALACDVGSRGVTERSAAASPRLERFRATLLRIGNGPRPSYYIRDRGGPFLVDVEDNRG